MLLKKDKSIDAEEVLRKLMVSFRTHIEAGHPYDETVVRGLLRQVSIYAKSSQDIRFQDCVTYFAELGIQLDLETDQ